MNCNMKKQYLIAVIFLTALFLFDGFIANKTVYMKNRNSDKPVTVNPGSGNKNIPVTTDQKQGMSDYHDPGFKKIIQVALVVKDIEASSRRWAELLGQEITRRQG